MYSVYKDRLQNCSLKQFEKYLYNDTSESEVNINTSVHNRCKSF
jgi:hypothetical protein